jgi:predicted phage tail component-like protein
MITIPNKAGAHYFGKQTGVRTFTLTITIAGTDADDLNDKISSIASWINSEAEEEIVFDKEADKSYFGFFTGNTDLDELVTIGTTTLTFIAPDPYAYGTEIETQKYTTSPFNFTPQGKELVYPEIFVKFTSPCHYFAFGNKKQSIFVGTQDDEKTLVAVNAKVINDGMDSTNPWQGNANLNTGIVQGSFVTNGTSLVVSDYGTATSGWHGPSLKRTITTPIQDFKLHAHVGMYSKEQRQMGRIEIFLLDINGEIIGRMTLADSSGYELSRFEASAGKVGSEHQFAEYYGSIAKEKKKIKHIKKVKGKKVTYYTYTPEEYSGVRDFHGDIWIQRKGNVWTAGLIKLDPDWDKELWHKSFKYTDKHNAFSDQVAGVAIHIGQLGTNAVMSPAYISYLELKNLKAVQDNEVQEIFDQDDELHISFEEGSVRLNGRVHMQDLDISSEFFGIQGGATTQLAFEPDEKCDITINYRPRYL